MLELFHSLVNINLNKRKFIEKMAAGASKQVARVVAQGTLLF